MQIGKTFTVNAPREKVWEFITSPEQVAPCVPGCEGADEIEPGKYKATIKVKVGPIKTTFKADVERSSVEAPEYATYDTKGEEGSGASRIKASSKLALKQLSATETEVTYSSDINIMGRLGKFGSGMMQKVADNIGDEFVNNVKQELEGTAPAEGAATSTGGSTALYWAAGIGIVALVALYFIFA